MDYRIITRPTAGELQREVANAIWHGFVPQGGIVATNEGVSQVVVCNPKPKSAAE